MVDGWWAEDGTGVTEMAFGRGETWAQDVVQLGRVQSADVKSQALTL